MGQGMSYSQETLQEQTATTTGVTDSGIQDRTHTHTRCGAWSVSKWNMWLVATVIYSHTCAAINTATQAIRICFKMFNADNVWYGFYLDLEAEIEFKLITLVEGLSKAMDKRYRKSTCPVNTQFPLTTFNLNECAMGCIWCPVIDWHPIQQPIYPHAYFYCRRWVQKVVMHQHYLIRHFATQQ